MDEKNVTLQIINKRRKFIMNKQIIITIQELLKGRDRNSDFDSAEEKRIKLVRHSGVIREDSVIGKDYYGQSVYELYRSNYPKFLEWQCEQNENKMKNVDYIVAFIGEEQCMCRFAGVYRNYGPKHKTLCGMFYDLKEVDGFEILKNQVVIDWGKGTLQWMQNWSTMKEVVRIDQVSDNEGIPYFTRYEDVSLNYSQLKQVVADNEWKTKLEACNCVYVITDKSNGKQYVGVTYKGSKAGAKGGILSRWTEYANSGHGEDVSLKKLCEGDSNYAEENFQWSILETLPLSVIPAIAINIETKWKEKLLTKTFGYNNN